MLNENVELKEGFDLGGRKDYLLYIKPPIDRFQQIMELGWIRYVYGNKVECSRQINLADNNLKDKVIKVINELSIMQAAIYDGLGKIHKSFFGRHDFDMRREYEYLKQNAANNHLHFFYNMADLKAFVSVASLPSSVKAAFEES